MNVELHIIQNFAPSCLNRDDTNTPKTCYFGGVERARISSQCFKRAIRLHMRDKLGQPTGVRTRLLAGVPPRLVAAGLDADEASARTKLALEAAGIGLDADRTAVGLYLADDEVTAIADAVRADWDSLAVAPEPTEGPKAKGRGKGKDSGISAPSVVAAVEALNNRVRSADIALYGRMMAERTNMNIDAACQVAHALSTHAVETEMDFFTAVDDLQPKEDTGAGMMGNQEFNSACFYRYALVNTGQLVANLGNDHDLARASLLAFVRAAIEAVPNARQNSSAAQNSPSYVQLVAGADLPASLANAFEQPVAPPRGGSLVQASIDALTKHQAALRETYKLRSWGQSYTFAVGQEGSDAGLLEWLAGQLDGGL